MSHYTCLVTIPPPADEDLEDYDGKADMYAVDYAQTALEPFDENQEVDPYWEEYDPTFAVRYLFRVEHPFDIPEGTPEYKVGELRRAATEIPDADDSRVQEVLTDMDRVLEAVLKYYADDDEEEFRLHDGKIERKTTYNPLSKWDWYELGGRWTGSLILKPRTGGVVGSPGLGADRASAGTADLARAGDVDWDAMAQKEEDRVTAAYESFVEAYGKPPDHTPWTEYVARVEAKTLAIDEARILYHNQPAVKVKFEGYLDRDELLNGLDYLKEKARLQGQGCYAMLHDGEWIAKGRMGWFGMSFDEVDDELAVYRRQVDIVRNLPDDAFVAVYDLHI